MSGWTLATEHGADLIEAKAGFAKDVSEANTKRITAALRTYLETVTDRAPASAVTSWTDLLVLSPIGYRSDSPTIATYHRRLEALAASVAADIERSRDPLD